MTAQIRIPKEYEKLTNDPVENVILEINPSNIFEWNFVIFGPKDTPYEGGTYQGILSIPKEYPLRPPQVKFTTKLFHPNVYTDGKLCISILHEGKDEFGYEHISERWNPSHSVNSILMSILSIISSPNFESPANVDASIMWRNNYSEYKKVIYKFITS
jgi:ubiquitin-conjugating enzyme E2 G1